MNDPRSGRQDRMVDIWLDPELILSGIAGLIVIGLGARALARWTVGEWAAGGRVFPALVLGCWRHDVWPAHRPTSPKEMAVPRWRTGYHRSRYICPCERRCSNPKLVAGLVWRSNRSGDTDDCQAHFAPRMDSSRDRRAA